MESKCQNCIYFCRHYVPQGDNTFLPVEYGHCIYGTTKMCRAARRACKHFQPKTADLPCVQNHPDR